MNYLIFLKTRNAGLADEFADVRFAARLWPSVKPAEARAGGNPTKIPTLPTLLMAHYETIHLTAVIAVRLGDGSRACPLMGSWRLVLLLELRQYENGAENGVTGRRASHGQPRARSSGRAAGG